MRTSSVRLLPLILFTLLAALTFWLDQSTRIGEQHNDGKDRHDPDFIVDKFTVRRYDASGRLQHVLTANKMFHYTDDDSTEVSQPELRYFSNGRTTELTAPRAWLAPEGKELRLGDAVRVVREGNAAEPATLLTTEEMVVFPDEEIARSHTPVTIVQGASVVNGTGLEADNKQQLYKLSGRVHAVMYKQKDSAP